MRGWGNGQVAHVYACESPALTMRWQAGFSPRRRNEREEDPIKKTKQGVEPFGLALVLRKPRVSCTAHWGQDCWIQAVAYVCAMSLVSALSKVSMK
jgi:hypothetical protein